ncbi:hypothetical protein [Pedobacter frigoris]|uniref:hypothetical protein n=1 Tax=Pedobacter frigoris TaxID=2571272 RepID=UPI00292E051F|nr:hypothetical protein [Pedobacter frigoris]
MKSGDTTLHLFNYYFTSHPKDLTPLNVKELSKSIQGLKYVYNDILVTAVPIIKPGDTLKYTQIDPQKISSLTIIDKLALLKQAIAPIYAHATTRNFEMPALKTLEYNLIIKQGKQYFKISQPVLVVYNLICNNMIYFPNQFKDGILTASDKYSKGYNMGDFKEIADETKNAFIWKELENRTYLSETVRNNPFNLKIFSYWEFLNADVESIKLNPAVLKQYHPGLGSFDLLPKVGIVNCTMDYYLTGKILFNQKSRFKIMTVNGKTPQSFGKLYQPERSNEIKAVE